MISNFAQFYDFNGVIDNSARVDDFCIVSGTVNIGCNCHVGPFSILSGKTDSIDIGKYVGISSRVSVYTASENFFANKSGNPTIDSDRRDLKTGKVIIEDFVMIGAGTIIMPNVIIGKGASISAGSIITKNIPPGAIVGPAYKMSIFGYRDIEAIEKFISDQ